MAKTEIVRQANIQQILDVFIKEEICTKNMLHEATGLSLGTCTNLLQKLLAEGKIIRLEDGPSTGGRKAKRYSIAKNFIQIGLIVLHHHENSDEVKGKVINLRQNEVFSFTQSYEKLKKEKLFELIDQMKTECPDMKLLALSIPGIVDQGCISFCDIDDLKDTSLQQELSDRFELKIILENDVNLAALGYDQSLSEKTSSLALVYQPSDQYSGCGLIIDGKLVHGATHFAGELGYLPIETREQQQKSLKTKKGATILLAKQIASLVAIINPDVVIIASKKISSVEKLKTKIGKWIEARHLPQLIQIDELDSWIFSGLTHISLEQLRVKIHL